MQPLSSSPLNLARVLPLVAGPEPGQYPGRVIAVEREVWHVDTPAGPIMARRAASCLVEPMVDDRVWVVALEGACYVLAVLERTPGASLRLQLNTDVQLEAADGALTLKAAGGLRFESARAIDLLTNKLNIVAEQGSLLIHSLSLLSECLRLDTSRAALVASAIETFAECISTRATRVTRHTSELEQVQAGELQLRVDDTLDVRGRNALLNAKHLLKLNGEQVHVG